MATSAADVSSIVADLHHVADLMSDLENPGKHIRFTTHDPLHTISEVTMGVTALATQIRQGDDYEAKEGRTSTRTACWRTSRTEPT